MRASHDDDDDVRSFCLSFERARNGRRMQRHPVHGGVGGHRQQFETAAQRRAREEDARKTRNWNRTNGPPRTCPLGLECDALGRACGNLCRTCTEWYIAELDDDEVTPASGFRRRKFRWEALVFALRSAAPLTRREQSGCASREEDAKEKRVTPFFRWMFDEATKLNFTWSEVIDENLKLGVRNLLIKTGNAEF